MFKELARETVAVLSFLFPRWMERLKRDVREEKFGMAIREHLEAREGGLGTRITEIRGGRAEAS
jgi:hypothetical protein